MDKGAGLRMFLKLHQHFITKKNLSLFPFPYLAWKLGEKEVRKGIEYVFLCIQFKSCVESIIFMESKV